MHKAHIADWKKKEVIDLVLLLEKYKIIAVADMTNMPSVQLQKMRSTLKDSVVIKMSKKSLILIAIDNIKSKHNIVLLKEYVRGMPALLLTNDNPFKLAKILNNNKSAAPAKGGQIAPNDILIKAGPTSFPPGPIIGELAQIGLKAGIVDGKVAIKEDKIIVYAGEVIPQQVAGILTRLGIEPMEIGINLTAAYENGVIFANNILSVDQKKFILNLKNVIVSALNLSVYIAFPTKENINVLIKKAIIQTKALENKIGLSNLDEIKKKIKLTEIPQEIHKKEEIEVNKPKEVIKEEVRETKKGDKNMEEFKSQEQAAQDVLNKLQEQKMKHQPVSRPIPDAKFIKDEAAAQDIIKKLQDEKIKKGK